VRLSLRALLIGAGLAALACPAQGGWVIDQVTTGQGVQRQQVVTIAANRMKTVTVADGQPVNAMVLDLDAQTITQVDYAARTYLSATVQEFVQFTQSSRQAVDQRMEEAMKSLPPERRRMMEEMMRRRGGGTGPCAEPKAVDVRKTAEQQTIAGFSAVRYDVLADGQPETEVWVAPAITAWKELDRAKLERFGAEMAKIAACGQGGRGPASVLGTDQSWKLASEGYPVRTARARGGGSEVTKAEERPVPAADFDPPVGFTRRTLGEAVPRAR
jgi:hypothetical protein